MFPKQSTRHAFATLFVTIIALLLPAAHAQKPADHQGQVLVQSAAAEEATDRELRHQSIEWQNLAPHLPDPATGSAKDLQIAADVMRARRMPDDALDYYHFALARGGDEAILQNRIGVTMLELHRPVEARIAFRRVLQLHAKDARAWNNLGAAEYMAGLYRVALDDYSRAVKLEKKTAVFHSNLGTAYFQLKDYDSARDQFERAMKLNPRVFQDSGFAGVEAHVLSADDHGRFCYEMARLSAKQHDDESVLRWLARASESGFDIRAAMSLAPDFDPYRKDPRVATIIKNAKAMRGGGIIAETSVKPQLPTP